MIVKGKLKKLLPEISGINKAGNEWKKQDFIIDTGAQFNPELCISTFKENIDVIKNIKIGSELEIELNLYSKPYNDKYFHNIIAWKITVLDSQETPF
tara:strand:- start:3484 stop:3774 length:291 start_codon:yes stop_codon:yes gene_type:complete